MGRYTLEKYTFDALTEDYFISRGYIIEAVRGVRADVVAYHNELRELAVIEVKGPNEVHGQTGWNTKHNLHNLNREEILELIAASEEYRLNPGIMKLYAYTISSQLYTYYKEAHVRIHKIIKKYHMSGKIVIIPYLVVPNENGQILREVLKIFKNNRLIKGSHTQRPGRFTIVSIRYYKRNVGQSLLNS